MVESVENGVGICCRPDIAPPRSLEAASSTIGGFLGMGNRLVVVPYETLKFADKKVMLPGGTKEGLKMLPEFKYATG